MKKFLMSAAALCLLLAAPAMAQPDKHDADHGGDRGGRPAAHGQPSGKAPATRPAPAARPTPAARPAVTARPAITRPDNNNRPGLNRPGNDNRPGTNRPGNGNNRPGTNRPGNNNNRPDFNRPGNNNRPGVNRPGNNRPGARPDYSKYRRAVTAPRRYRVGRYHAPAGYRYQRWNYGQRLPSMYYASTFWLSNFIAYGLFAPPPDAVWVRYGPDALLVDRYTGEIISVEYGAFY